MKNKERYAVHILFVLLAILIEIFICNIRSFQSMFYTEKDISEYPVQLDYVQLLPNGDLLLDDDVAYISIIVGDEKINNICIDAEVADAPSNEKRGSCDVTLYIQDDLISGGENKIRSVSDRTLLYGVEASHYYFFESFGNTKLLQLEFRPQNGRVLHLNSIKLNSPKPVLFSVIRSAFFLLVMEAFFLFRPESWIWQRRALVPGKRGNVLVWGIYAGFMLLMTILMAGNPPMWNDKHNPYAELAEAISEGHLYVGEADPEVAALEGCMLSWSQMDDRIMFDHALYKGKFYVYFGILPEIVMYLPFFVITGMWLPDSAAMLLMSALFIPGLYFLLKELIRRFFPKTPLALLLILTVAAVMGVGLPKMLAASQVYTVAILSGVLLTVWGVYFWLRALPFAEHPVYMLCGSCCMALVAACRPDMLVYSVVIIPLGLYSYKAYKKTQSKKNLILYMAGIAVPYIVVAICLMYYNLVRFDSPFQFGMTYNMTNIAAGCMSVDIPEMLYIAFYEYLFKPIEFDHVFPFVKAHFDDCVKEYSGTIYYYRTCGYGLFSQTPILLVLFIAPFLQIKKKKEFNMLLLCTLFATVFFICFDTYLTQWITARYSMEFSFLMFLSADIAWLIIWSKIEKSLSNAMIWSFVLVNSFSVIIGLLSFFSGLEFPLNMGNPELYYDFFYTFHFL